MSIMKRLVYEWSYSYRSVALQNQIKTAQSILEPLTKNYPLVDNRFKSAYKQKDMETSEELLIRSFKSQVWSAFQCLMDGCLLFKYYTIQPQNIMCLSQSPETLPHDYY